MAPTAPVLGGGLVNMPIRIGQPGDAEIESSAPALDRLANFFKRDGCSSSTAGDSCEKPSGGGGSTLPIVLGVAIPVVIAVFVLLYLHRRNVRRLKKEDAKDPNTGLDFGLDENPKSKRKSFFGGEKKSNKSRQLSLDMSLPSPYLLPPGTQHSHETIYSLARTIPNQQDPYRTVKEYTSSDAGSIRSMRPSQQPSLYATSNHTPSLKGRTGSAAAAAAASMPKSNSLSRSPASPISPLSPTSPFEKANPFNSPPKSETAPRQPPASASTSASATTTTDSVESESHPAQKLATPQISVSLAGDKTTDGNFEASKTGSYEAPSLDGPKNIDPGLFDYPAEAGTSDAPFARQKADAIGTAHSYDDEEFPFPAPPRSRPFGHGSSNLPPAQELNFQGNEYDALPRGGQPLHGNLDSKLDHYFEAEALDRNGPVVSSAALGNSLRSQPDIYDELGYGDEKDGQAGAQQYEPYDPLSSYESYGQYDDDGRGRSSWRQAAMAPANQSQDDGYSQQQHMRVPRPESKRLSVGFRPLPPSEVTESEDPEYRANRIRSFYKEYFEDGGNGKEAPQPGRSPAAVERQDFHEYEFDPPYQDDVGYLGDAAYYDADTNTFVMPYAQRVERRAMTPPPVGRFRGGLGGPAPWASRGPHAVHGSIGGMSLPGSSRRLRAGSSSGPRPESSASAWSRGRGPGRKRLPPPSPLNTLPTPSKLKDDSFALYNATDFAPPDSFRDHAAGRSQSPLGERRPYQPKVPPASPLVTAFDELPVLPSPHLLRKSSTFTNLDFAPPKKFKDSDTMSDAGSIRSNRSNRSGISAVHLGAIRNGAGRVSRLPGDMVFTHAAMADQLKPQWNMRS